jgi:hypothetical protein
MPPWARNPDHRGGALITSPTVTRGADGLRFVVAAGTAAVGALYLLIATDTIAVPGVAGVEEGPAVPLLIAGGLFVLLAGLAALRPHRTVWMAGAALQLLVIVGYIAVSAERDPAFEAWGLGLKAMQVALFVVLARLALRRPVDPDR